MPDIHTETELNSVISSIKPASRELADITQKRLDNIAKPLKSLGMLEDVLVRLGAVGSIYVDGDSRDIKERLNACVAVMCADNGVVSEGVSQTGSEVTAKVAANMAEGLSSVCLMAKSAVIDVFLYDCGMNTDVEGVKSVKTVYGTDDFYNGPAMSRKTAVAAICAGVNIAVSLKAAGYDMIATGEMGIGNTTTSAAVLSVLTGMEPCEVTGRGAGLSDAALARKIEVIKHGIRVNSPVPTGAIDVVAKVGGLDIAAMAGLYLGGAACGMPVIMDGFISGVAALVAARLAPSCVNYMVPSHLSKEPGAAKIFEELGLKPLMSMGMALGEGTGAVSVVPLINMALSVYRDMPLFSDLNMDAYKDYGKKLILVAGGSGSGKSEYAEKRVSKLHDKAVGKGLYYIATMVSTDAESDERIDKHIRRRAGMSFITIEKPTDIGGVMDMGVNDGATVLVECMSNLLANEMFAPDGFKNNICDYIMDGVKRLCEHCNVVIVTDIVNMDVYGRDGHNYDAATIEYIDNLNTINSRIASVADEVIEVVAGIALSVK